MADRVIVVDGLNNLVRACRVSPVKLALDVRSAIEQAGEPIRQDAQNRVRSEISGMARSRLPWWSIRAGVERNTIGYIVPAQRGTYTKRNWRRYARPKLAPRIAEKEEAARDANAHLVEDEFNDALRELKKSWDRV